MQILPNQRSQYEDRACSSSIRVLTVPLVQMSVSHFSLYFIIFFKLPAFKAPVNAVIDKFGSCSSVNSVARLVVDVGIYSSDQNLLNLSPLTLTHYQDDDSGN